MTSTRSAQSTSASSHHQVPEVVANEAVPRPSALKLAFWGQPGKGSGVHAIDGLDPLVACKIEGGEIPESLEATEVDAILIAWDEWSTIEECLRRVRSRDALASKPVLVILPETTDPESLSDEFYEEVEVLFPGATLAEVLFRIERSVRVLSARKKHDSLEVYKKKLVESIAHDVRSPLHTVSFALDLIQESLEKENSRFVKMILGAKESTAKITEIMDMMLKIHQLGDSNGALSLSEVDLHTVVSEAIALNNDPATVCNEVEPQTLILADRPSLVRSFEKLIRNSLRYIPVEDGRITIRAEKTDSGVSIMMEENAKPLPVDFLEEVFEMFARVPEPEGKLGRSFGLDFAFCRASIQSQGGSLKALSNGESGNVFATTMRMPE